MTPLLALVLGCAVPATDAVAPSRARLPDVVDESSALAVSGTHPGVLWTLNDSGGAPALYAVGAQGDLLATVTLDGATNVDWEAMALRPDGRLAVGDVGNNASDRRDLTIYLLDEPPPVDGRVAVDRAVRVRFPEQAAFPDPALRFDAEALAWDGDTLLLFSKHRRDLDTVLYRVPLDRVPPDADGVALEPLGTWTLGGDPDRYGGMATDAAVHPSGRVLALLSYHAVFLFERPLSGHDWTARPLRTVPLDQDVLDQTEAIAWDGWSLVLTNEDGVIFRMADPFRATSFP